MSFEPMFKQSPAPALAGAAPQKLYSSLLFVHSVDTRRSQIFFGVSDIPDGNSDALSLTPDAVTTVSPVKTQFADKLSILRDPASEDYFVEACAHCLPSLHEPGINNRRIYVVDEDNNIVKSAMTVGCSPLMCITFSAAS